MTSVAELARLALVIDEARERLEARGVEASEDGIVEEVASIVAEREAAERAEQEAEVRRTAEARSKVAAEQARIRAEALSVLYAAIDRVVETVDPLLAAMAACENIGWQVAQAYGPEGAGWPLRVRTVVTRYLGFRLRAHGYPTELGFVHRDEVGHLLRPR